VVAVVTAAGGTISILAGAVLLRLTFTGTYTRYVRAGMAPWLIVAGVVVIALGVVTLVRALRSPADDTAPDSDPDGDHQHDARVGWLLLAPVAALLLVAPPTLGSYGVERAATVDVRAGAGVFDPLPAGAEPVPMTLLEFGQRAFDRDGATLRGATVQLTGFVAGGEDGGFRLARYQIACCAADAAPVVVRVVGVRGSVPSQDRWVTVTGSVRPGDQSDGEIPELSATSVVEIEAPDDPYE
jgi:uncharacterized repeat protein (TIGR03943 family)